MKKLLLVPALLLAACGDNLHDTDDQTAFGTDDGAVPDDGEDTPARPFEASPLITFPSCDAAVASYEADGRYTDTDELEFVPNVSCLWKFDDGSTSTSCIGSCRRRRIGSPAATGRRSNGSCGSRRA